MKDIVLLSGNESIARGAYEAGVRVAAGYPGTPSTEILENIIRYDGIYAEWAPNEKVALEVALGAAYGGARALATMKHVGVNVAADPLLTASYTGVNGGLVLVSADDMLIIRGVNVYPTQIESILLQIEGTAPHYLIVVDRVDSMDQLEVWVEVSEQVFSDEIKQLEALEKKIEHEIQSVLGIHVAVKLVEPKTIERSEGKAKRVVDNRPKE